MAEQNAYNDKLLEIEGLLTLADKATSKLKGQFIDLTKKAKEKKLTISLAKKTKRTIFDLRVILRKNTVLSDEEVQKLNVAKTFLSQNV